MNKLLGFIIGLAVTITAQADQPGFHGMLLFGGDTTYASHLPMFHQPHDYQVVMEIKFSGPSKIVEIYNNEKKTSKGIFTLDPEKMDLTKVISGEIKSFTADLYIGHFEQGGTNLGKVTVNVEKIILGQKLNPSAPETFKYLVFGNKDGFFAVHLIGGKPNYDAVVEVSAPYHFEFQLCQTKLCEEGNTISKPLPTLPIELASPGSAGKEIPKEGQTLGTSNSYYSLIYKVIYAEAGELSH
ncbi:MAG: hypothetical protein V4736_12245 [Bdellovibrionota bacterium]